MDAQEQSQVKPKEIEDFEPQQHLTPLENSAISASVKLIIDGKPVLLGEGKEATSIDDLAQTHPDLLSVPAGVINGSKSLEDINAVRIAKGIVNAYLGMYGPQVMLDMMMKKIEGGLVIGTVEKGDPASLSVFLKNDEGYLNSPPELVGDLANIITFNEARVVHDRNGQEMTALVYSSIEK